MSVAWIRPGAEAVGAEPTFKVGKVEFAPPYVEAGQTTTVDVAVELKKGGPESGKLQLEEVVPRSRARESTRRLATLRSDGGSTFSGTVRFRDPACGGRRLRVRRSDGGADRVSPVFELPSAAAYLAAAPLLPTRILDLAAAVVEVFEIDAIRDGTALVTLNGAAQAGASINPTVDLVVNGAPVLSLPGGADCAQGRIELRAGINQIRLLSDGPADDRVALRIDALADQLVLRTVEQPSARAGSPLRAQARVTALGLPVPDAEVEFRLEGERSSKQVRPTNDAGVAAVSFAASDASGGQALLTARLRNSATDLRGEAAVVLEEAAKISLGQPLDRLTMEAGAETALDLAIRVDQGGPYEIDLDQQVTPGTGLELTAQLPGGGLAGDRPGTFVVRQVFKALEPGIYDVVTKAALAEASAETALRIVVGPEEAKNGLVIYQPSADPAILQPKAGSQQVIFKVAVAGTSTPPESLVLQQLADGSLPAQRASARPPVTRTFARSSTGSGVLRIIGDLLPPSQLHNDIIPIQFACIASPPEDQGDPDVASEDSKQTDEDVSITINVMENDEDGSGIITSVTQPRKGSVSITSDSKAVTYTPSPNFNGCDFFTYEREGFEFRRGKAGVAVLVVAVNDSPAANDDPYEVRAGNTLVVEAPGVLDNDRDIDGDALHAEIYEAPSVGNVALDASGKLTYTAPAAFQGSVSFTYLALDGSPFGVEFGVCSGGCDVGTVTVTVVPPPPPTATLTADPERIKRGGSATLSWESTDAESCQGDGFSTGRDTSGKVEVSPTTTTAYTVTCSNINDSDTDSATVIVDVPPPPPPTNQAPIARNDPFKAVVGEPLTVAPPGVLANDESPNGNQLTAILISGPSLGTVDLKPNGGFTYTARSAGTDQFRYEVFDGHDVDVATVTIEVAGKPEPPPPPPPPPVAEDPCIEPEPVSEVVGDPAPPESVVVLRDDGEGPDATAGDLVYTGVADVDAAVETRLLYRVVAEYRCGIVASRPFELPVADLPTELFPTSTEEFPLVEDPVTGERFASNQVVVRFRPDVTPAEIRRIVEREEDAEIIGFDPALNLAQIKSDHADGVVGVRRAMASFAVYEEVAYAEPNHEIVLDGFPDDPEFPDQKSLDLVRAIEAWLAAGATPDEGDARNIAILDSGVDYDHKDLKQRVLKGKNRKVIGKNCVDLKKDPMDESGHGTRVAGVAAAATGNGQDVAGAGLDAKFVPVKIAGIGTSYMSEADCGLKYVREHPEIARIANLSFGSRSASQSLRDEVEAALDKGIMLVAAAGNKPPFSRKEYPAAYNEVLPGTEEASDNGLIAVANTDDKDHPYNDEEEGTKRGPWVDLGAPGVKVLTTELEGPPESHSGTSFAAPLVAGASALLWSRDPNATVEEIERQLKGAAKRAKTANEIGDGRLDFGETILNGSAELYIREDGSPGDWPSAANSTCSYERPPAGRDASTFFQARHGRQFLLCEGLGQAATRKAFEVPQDIKRLTFTVRLAGIAPSESDEVFLEAEWEGADGKLEMAEADAYSLTSGQCQGDFNLSGAPPDLNCSGWKDWNQIVVKNPRPGRSAITFRARLAESASPVWLMLDDLRIEEVK